MFYYFLEIKYRIFFIILCWFILVVINYYYKNLLLFVIIKPCLKIVINKEVYFVYSNITEILYNYVLIVLFISTIITFWFFFFHLIDFVKLGLYHNEIYYMTHYIRYSIAFSLFCFFSCYFYFIPKFWFFFFNYSNSETINFNFFFEIKLEEYLYFYFNVLKICLIVSQTITLLYFWVKKNIKFIITCKNTRKRIYVLLFILSTMITPPDVISQLVIGWLFVIIYEFLIYCFIFKKLTR